MNANALTIVEQSFTTADLVLISAIALVCAGVMRNYRSIFLAVFFAVVVDFTLPATYALLIGASTNEALQASTARLAGYSGLALLVRSLAYFAAISVLFGAKAAYWRR